VTVGEIGDPPISHSQATVGQRFVQREGWKGFSKREIKRANVASPPDTGNGQSGGRALRSVRAEFPENNPRLLLISFGPRSPNGGRRPRPVPNSQNPGLVPRGIS
jgi:hypothetical protein